MGRIAGWAALASILAFLRVQPRRGTAPLRDRDARGPRALLLPEARPASLGAQRRASWPWWRSRSSPRPGPPVRPRPQRDPNPVQWLPWNAATHLFETQDTGVAPSLATEMLVVPSDLHYTYGGTTLVGPFVTLIPRQLWQDKPLPAGSAGPRRGVGGHALRARRPVQHVLALRGALSRRRPGGGVHLRACSSASSGGRPGSTTFATATPRWRSSPTRRCCRS